MNKMMNCLYNWMRLDSNRSNEPTLTVSDEVSTRRMYPQSCTCHGISSCDSLQSLKQILDENEPNADHTSLALHSFLHLLQRHDKDFEYIHHELGGFCDIIQCVSFNRNYRDRNKTNYYNDNQHPEEIVYHQITDKIHCHFRHCFDIGNRLTLKEQTVLNEQNSNPMDVLQMISNNIKKMHQILSEKRTMFRRIDRFNTLDIKHKVPNRYRFGVMFKYGDDDPHNGHFGVVSNVKLELGPISIPVPVSWSPLYWLHKLDRYEVLPKYGCLKEELTSNRISVMSMKQFQSEYMKAKMHYNSFYKISNRNWNELSLNHLLALMIYCNYTALQYEFSRTYRENVKQHRNFYHLGKYIKIAIHKFGTEITSASGPTTFYHGVGEKLPFSAYCDAQICGPLSTTTSLSVAMQFTNHNQGMVVEFGHYNKQTVKYFALSWLSDYGNENEHLFIQNVNKMGIYNITFVSKVDTWEFRAVLNVLPLIHKLANGGSISQTAVDASTAELITALISHQLSKRFPDKYMPLQSLHPYGEQIMDTFCKNVWRISFHHNRCMIPSESIHETFVTLYRSLFVKEHCEWINTEIICSLFPNARKINMYSVIMCPSMLDDIISYLQYGTNVKLDGIWIDAEKSICSISPLAAVSKYRYTFKRLGYEIKSKYNGKQLHIHKIPDTKVDHTAFLSGLNYLLDNWWWIGLYLINSYQHEFGQEHLSFLLLYLLPNLKQMLDIWMK